MTEVGWIPKDWEVSIVGNECDVKTGPFGSALHADDYVIKGTPIITVEHIGNIHIDRSKQIPQVSEEDKQRLKAYILKEGDIVFSRVGSIDRNSLVFKEEDGWLFSGRLLRMRKLPKAKFDPLYLCYHLNTYDSRNRILAEAVGQTMPSLNTKILNGISIVLPQSISEQRRIAEVLSDTDSLIASLSRTIEKKRLVKQGAMQQLLTGKTRLKGFSGEWVEKELGEIGQLTGAGVDKTIKDDETPVRLLNFLDVYNRDRIYSRELKMWVTASEMKIQKCDIRCGDIFLTPSSELPNDIGRSAVAMQDIQDACYSYHILRLRPYEKLDLNYSAYMLKTAEFEQQIRFLSEGSGKRYVISLKNFREIRIQIPSDIREQEAIGLRIATMDNEIASLEAELQKYKALKQGMMQKLLTGQIRLK